MTRVLIGHRARLAGEAVATVLGQSGDIAVVATMSRTDAVIETVHLQLVDVAVLDADLVGSPPVDELCQALSAICSTLLIVDPDRHRRTHWRLHDLLPKVGFVSTDSTPDALVRSIRLLAAGNRVLVDVLSPPPSKPPRLTRQELLVLRYAAEGLPVAEIACILTLSPGTIRSYLSRVMTKTGTRSRIAAIGIAQSFGLI